MNPLDEQRVVVEPHFGERPVVHFAQVSLVVNRVFVLFDLGLQPAVPFDDMRPNVGCGLLDRRLPGAHTLPLPFVFGDHFLGPVRQGVRVEVVDVSIKVGLYTGRVDVEHGRGVGT